MSIENIYMGITGFLISLFISFFVILFAHYAGIVFFEYGYEYNLTTMPSRLGWDVILSIMAFDFFIALSFATPIGILTGVFGA